MDAERYTVGLKGEVEPLDSKTAVSLIVSEGLTAYLPMKGLLDFEKEIARLEKQLTKAEKDLAGLQKRLDSPNFASKAPPQVVTETEAQADLLREKVNAVRTKISDVQKLSTS